MMIQDVKPISLGFNCHMANHNDRGWTRQKGFATQDKSIRKRVGEESWLAMMMYIYSKRVFVLVNTVLRSTNEFNHERKIFAKSFIDKVKVYENLLSTALL